LNFLENYGIFGEIHNFFKLGNFLVNVCFFGKLYGVLGKFWDFLGNFSVFQGKSKVFGEILKFLGWEVMRFLKTLRFFEPFENFRDIARLFREVYTVFHRIFYMFCPNYGMFLGNSRKLV